MEDPLSRRERQIMNILCIGTLVVLASGVLCAQEAAAPRFEVATLKVSAPPEGDLIHINLGTFRNGRLTMGNVTLKDAIRYAYGLVSDDQIVGPDWNRSVRFDIAGVAPPETTDEAARMMTRELLAERLHVVLRREQKILPHLALVPAKGGAKLRAAAHDAAPNPGPQVPGRIVHHRMPISLLAAFLSRFQRQIVVDQTGLSGFFDVQLEWAPEAALSASEKASLFDAVQEQLGLRLESRRGPLEVLVVVQAVKVPEQN